MFVNALKRLLKKIRKITLIQVLYVISIFTFPTATYFYSKMNCMRPQNPEIIIDTSEIDCGCENFCSSLLEETKNKEESKSNEEEQTIENNLNSSENKLSFVASRNGEKYYPVDCKSANRIKEENRVYYETEEEAEEDGKELSSQCQ